MDKFKGVIYRIGEREVSREEFHTQLDREVTAQGSGGVLSQIENDHIVFELLTEGVLNEEEAHPENLFQHL